MPIPPPRPSRACSRPAKSPEASMAPTAWAAIPSPTWSSSAAGQGGAGAGGALEPFGRTGGENPYAIHRDLQECMQSLVGIIRTEGELKKALEKVATLRERCRRIKIDGNRQDQPAGRLALDLHSLLTVSHAV